MSGLFANVGKGISDRLEHRKTVRRAQAARQARIVDAVEQAVQSIDPRLRLVPGYARKLRPAVQRALDYAQEACAKVPGPVEISRDTWGTDPTVHALFATPAELCRALANDGTIKKFLAENRNRQVTHAYVVLAMDMARKTVLGIDQKGDIIRRDVPQVNVSFSGHCVKHAAPDRETLRGALQQRALNELTAQVLRRILAEKDRREALRKERMMLQSKLKAREGETAGLTGLETDDEMRAHDMEAIRARMASLETESADVKASVGTLNALIQLVSALLGSPEELIQVSPVTLHLDRMNRLSGEGASATDYPVRLAEITFGRDRKRVSVLAKISRDELTAEAGYIDQAERYLFSDLAPMKGRAFPTHL